MGPRRPAFSPKERCGLWALQLKDASQILEYGKNYKGYWMGELFVKQATFILPFLAYKVIY